MSRSSAPSFTRAGFTLMEIMIVMTLLAIISTAVISAYLFMGRNLERLAKTQQQDVRGRRALFQFTQDVGSAVSFTSTTTANLTMTVPTTLTLSNCATTSGSTTVTCTSTSGLVTGMSVSGPSSIPSSPATTVSSVTNGTTFIMSAAATATSAGLTVNAIGTPATVSYLYDSTAGTLTRTAGGVTTTILTNIDSTATNPSNGFAYYNTAGAAVTSAESTKTVEFAFTTRRGSLANGTRSIYKLVSPRVVARNKQFLP